MAFANPLYTVEILDSTLTPITRVRSLVQLDTTGTIISYKSILSDIGEAKIRVGTKDPMLTQYGDILQPWSNWLRITRGTTVVWLGMIVDCPDRNKNYIEVVAKSGLILLSKVLIRHDTSTSTGDGKDNYRLLNSGTMSTYVQTFLTEAKTDAGNLLSRLTVGTIENPTFPTGYKDTNNADLTGPWTFSSTFQLQFDYRDILWVIQQLAAYGVMDLEMTTDFIFNFKLRIGADKPDVMFEYGNYGSIEDYNAPLYGSRMANSLVGVAADYDSKILHFEKQDAASIAKYGKLQDVAAYVDVKNQNVLTTRLTEELKHTAIPNSELHLLLNDKAYPQGVYQLGDTVRVKIKDHAISVDQNRRIVAIEVHVKQNGNDKIKLVTNIPRT